jgi:hypothetical protein
VGPQREQVAEARGCRPIFEPGADVGRPGERQRPRGAARQVEQAAGERVLEGLAGARVVVELAGRVSADDENIGGRFLTPCATARRAPVCSVRRPWTRRMHETSRTKADSASSGGTAVPAAASRLRTAAASASASCPASRPRAASRNPTVHSDCVVRTAECAAARAVSAASMSPSSTRARNRHCWPLHSAYGRLAFRPRRRTPAGRPPHPRLPACSEASSQRRRVSRRRRSASPARRPVWTASPPRVRVHARSGRVDVRAGRRAARGRSCRARARART